LALSIKIFQNIFQIDFSTQFLGSDVQFNKKLTYTTQLQQTRPQHTQQTTLQVQNMPTAINTTNTIKDTVFLSQNQTR
jgi:hypothetical protein